MFSMDDEHEAIVADFPFILSSLATIIEIKVGETMLRHERKAGHVGRLPLSMTASSTTGVKTCQTQKSIELASYLIDSPNLGRVSLARVFGCSKETIGRRASNAVDLGLILRIRTKAATCGQPAITYVAVNNKKQRETS
tara:strand:- start:4349 stop:4765 length:417 start_codon:yes stop_codon:yes gene_type:complete